MIVEPIYKYLRSEGKTANEALLADLGKQITRRFRREFMQDQRPSERRLYATRVTGECPRRAAYAYLGFPAEPDEPRTIFNRRIGDIIEAVTFTLAKQAGIDIERPYSLLTDDGERMEVSRDGITLPCWPDGLVQAGGTYLNVEIKSMNGFVFDRDDRAGEVDNTWGYVTQTAMEVAAWRQKGLDVPATCFVGINKLNGQVREWIVPYDDRLVAAAFDRARQVLDAENRLVWLAKGTIDRMPDVEPNVADAINGDLPPRAYKPVFDKKSGRMKLGLNCSYCSWHQHCWAGQLNIKVERGKPIFYVEGAVA